MVHVSLGAHVAANSFVRASRHWRKAVILSENTSGSDSLFISHLQNISWTTHFVIRLRDHQLLLLYYYKSQLHYFGLEQLNF